MKNFFAALCLTSAFLSASAAELTEVQANSCIDQIKLRFKDPDSAKLVQIMGNRGMNEKAMGGATWIRYKSTNAYGAYVSSSMMCHPTEPVAVVAKSFELSCMTRVANALARKPGAFDNFPARYEESKGDYVKRAVWEFSVRAAGIVKEGIDDLPECNE